MTRRHRLFILPLMLIAATTATLRADDISVRVIPNPLFAGETAKYEIVSTVGSPRLLEFPAIDGIAWNQQSSNTSIQIRNFERTDTISYAFTANQPGTFVIPPLSVRAGNQVYKTPPAQINVTKRQINDQGATVSLDELIFLKVLYNGKEEPPTSLFLGEELTITITMYVDQRVQMYSDRFNLAESFVNPQNYFPNVALDNVVFRDYSQQNPHNGKFLYRDAVSQIMNGQRYQVFEYTASVAAIEVGAIQGKIEHTVPVMDPNQERGRTNDPLDGFFGNDFFNRGRRTRILKQQLVAVVPPISILSIPPDIATDGLYLGLIGDWEIQLAIDQSVATVGEDITLTLSAQGHGNVETFRVPSLDLPGFRIYPPEVTRESAPSLSKGTVRWVIIPLNTESQFPKLTFTTFDTRSQQHSRHEFHPQLSVKTPSIQTTSQPTVEDYTVTPAPTQTQAKPIQRATDILYIKKGAPSYIRLPLWNHVRMPVTLLGCVSPVIYVAVLLLALRQERLAGDHSYRRRRDALRGRGRLLRKIQRAKADELPGIIRDELNPYLLATLHLPPGTTNSELLAQIRDPELAELLRQAEIGGFMPGSSSQIDAKKLIDKIKKLAVLPFLLLLCLDGRANEPMKDAALAYDQGDLAAAEQTYGAMLRDGYGSPELLYNLGNCAYRRGDFGLAILYYEQARRLAPRDSDISENLSFVRSQMNLPPVIRNDDPIAIMNGLLMKLRPDEWFSIAAGAWCMAWIAAAVLRWRQAPSRLIPVVAGALALCALSAGIVDTRMHYRQDQAVIISHHAPMYRLPTDGGDEKAKLILDAGQYVSIAEERAEWSRIRFDQSEGWVKNGAVRQIW